jgi:glucosyl-dolichyl phosphate glucuronosyltransferase
VAGPLAFSAIICTRDRYDLLPTAIDSLVAQDLDKGRFEIIVVDNGDDAQRAVDFAGRYAGVKNLSFVHEPVPGLSVARNTGARLARGDILAYLDDDAIAAPNWLRELLAAYEKFGEAAAIAGGPVEPIWVTPRPKWLTKNFEGMFTIVDWGGACREVDYREWLAGCNYSIRRDRLLALGGFPTNLGRKGGGLSLLSNEEIEISDAIRRQGGKVIYAPAARVKHRVDPSRVNADWIKRRIAWQAVSDVLTWPDQSLQNATTASKNFARLSRVGRGILFSSLLDRKEDVSLADYARIYYSILILLTRGS